MTPRPTTPLFRTRYGMPFGSTAKEALFGLESWTPLQQAPREAAPVKATNKPGSWDGAAVPWDFPAWSSQPREDRIPQTFPHLSLLLSPLEDVLPPALHPEQTGCSRLGKQMCLVNADSWACPVL